MQNYHEISPESVVSDRFDQSDNSVEPRHPRYFDPSFPQLIGDQTGESAKLAQDNSPISGRRQRRGEPVQLPAQQGRQAWDFVKEASDGEEGIVGYGLSVGYDDGPAPGTGSHSWGYYFTKILDRTSEELVGRIVLDRRVREDDPRYYDLRYWPIPGLGYNLLTSREKQVKAIKARNLATGHKIVRSKGQWLSVPIPPESWTRQVTTLGETITLSDKSPVRGRSWG
jgi:hypothetical protein